MPNLQHGCVVCTAPAGDGYGCITCARKVAAILRSLHHHTNQAGRETPGLLDDLQAVVTRSTTHSSGPHVATGNDQPLPFDVDASELSWVADNTIATWARDFAGSNPHLRPDYATHAGTALWLSRYPDLLRLHPAFDELHDELTDLHRNITRTVDTAPDRVYLGHCGHRHPDTGDECHADLYGRTDSRGVTCRACGADHDAHARWTAMQDKVRHTVATATEIAAASLRLYGASLNAKTIRTWCNRGLIGTRGNAPTGEPLHLVGEVLDFAARRVGSAAA